MSAEFFRVFAKESEDALEWAFQVWRDRSPFFPAVCEIRALVIEFKRGQREQLELKSAMDERFLLEEARKRGELVDFPAFVREMLAHCKALPESDEQKRYREYMEKSRLAGRDMPQAISGLATLHFSPEQIQARRDKERAEIERYREECFVKANGAE